MQIFGLQENIIDKLDLYEEFSFKDADIETALESIDYINNQLGLEAEANKDETKTENKENIFKKALNKIKEMFKKFIDWCKKIWNKIFNKEKDIKKEEKKVEEELVKTMNEMKNELDDIINEAFSESVRKSMTEEVMEHLRKSTDVSNNYTENTKKLQELNDLLDELDPTISKKLKESTLRKVGSIFPKGSTAAYNNIKYPNMNLDLINEAKTLTSPTELITNTFNDSFNIPYVKYSRVISGYLSSVESMLKGEEVNQGLIIFCTDDFKKFKYNMETFIKGIKQDKYINDLLTGKAINPDYFESLELDKEIKKSNNNGVPTKLIKDDIKMYMNSAKIFSDLKIIENLLNKNQNDAVFNKFIEKVKESNYDVNKALNNLFDSFKLIQEFKLLNQKIRISADVCSLKIERRRVKVLLTPNKSK